MEQWQLAAAASKSASGRCVPIPGKWLGWGLSSLMLGLVARSVVLGPGYQHPFINWIEVATDVA